MKIRHVAIAVAVILAYFAWRWAFYRIFYFEAEQYVGEVVSAEMEALDFSQNSRYGKKVMVRLFGVNSVLYLLPSEPGDILPGDKLSCTVKIKLSGQKGTLLSASQRDTLVLSRPDKTSLRVMPAIWRNKVLGLIGNIWPGETGAFVKALLTGYTVDMPDDLSEDLFSNGMTHVAAVSGLHISMLTGFIVLIAGNRRYAAFVALPVILIFVAVAGFPPSAVRAGIMMGMYLLAPFLMREYSSKRAVIVAFLLLLVINPDSLFDPGLQLSFSSTFGMILFSGKLKHKMLVLFPRTKAPETDVKIYAKARSMLTKTADYLISSCAATLSAMAFSVPIAAYWFKGVSILAPISNVLLLWMVTVIFMLALAALGLSLIWWPLGYFVGQVAAFFIFVFRSVLGIFAQIPYAVLSISQMLLCAWLLFAYLLVVWGFLTKAWKPAVICISATLVPILLLNSWLVNRPALTISVLDVGQGQCIVLRSGGKTAIIDCGSNSIDPSRSASMFLRGLGESRVDLLLLTHLHSDHANGAESLMRRVNVTDVYLSQTQEEMPSYSYTLVENETQLKLGNAELTLIPSGWMDEVNEQCMTIVCTVGGFSFVVTGDLGEQSERWLLRYTTLPHSGVIVAGHHGSSTSTCIEWLEALTPQAAVISVGQNTFGHPSEQTLSRLEESGAAIYRTDEMGTVEIRVR